MGPRSAPAPHEAALPTPALRIRGAAGSEPKAGAAVSGAGGSGLSSRVTGLGWKARPARGSLRARDKASGRRRGLLVGVCSGVLPQTVGSAGRHRPPFPQRILTATRLVWRTCLSRWCFRCVPWSGRFFCHTYQNNISAPFGVHEVMRLLSPADGSFSQPLQWEECTPESAWLCAFMLT